MLIIEDDTDWDVTVKDQMRRYAKAVRDFTAAPLSDLSPYGASWDVLWVGHCGEASRMGVRRHRYTDPSRVTFNCPHHFGTSVAWNCLVPQTHFAPSSVAS